MAVIEGRRYLGLSFYKEKGRKAYVAEHVPNPCRSEYAISHYPPVVDYAGDDPLAQRFRYCSPVSQSAFIAPGTGPLCKDNLTPTSWNKMPEGWRDIFRRDLINDWVQEG